jgi:hypothetical protein
MCGTSGDEQGNLKQNFREVYYPQENVAIDESLINVEEGCATFSSIHGKGPILVSKFIKYVSQPVHIV